MKTPLPHPDDVKSQLVRSAEPFRVQALRVISAIGFLLIAIGSVDVNGLLPLLPDNVAAWLIAGGALLAGAKQVLLVIGDWLDNYKLDKSFNLDKLGTLLLVAAAGTLLCGCGLQFTEDGCVLAAYKRGGSTYYAGACVGPDKNNDGTADVNRYRVQWSNDDGQQLRTTYWTDNSHPVLVEYLTNGLWIAWTAKAGVTLGEIPPPVETALAGNPEPINTAGTYSFSGNLLDQ